MEMTNTRIVPAPPAAVWRALNDPAALKASIPGCESMERTGDDEWHATMAAKIGPVSARFSGTMKMTESNPPNGYTLKFEGQGGAAGFANGEARVTLVPAEGDQTALTYVVKAQVGGKLAQIGSRLIDGAAAKIADEFFERFSQRLAPAPSAVLVETGAFVENAAGRAPNNKTWIRYVAIALMLAIVAYLALRGRG
ncbi:MAG: carbon monoxide dehydrogenase subunit G [Betaproteobacteria bacterium]